MDIQEAITSRYGAASKSVEPALCCPTEYDAKYLEAIPESVLERDYGCGDPSKHVRSGDTVLDLGSGSGKICFIASQVVGADGKVIGVDMTDDMLDLANSARPVVAERVGYDNVEFRKGDIADMRGIVDDDSIDVVVSNCVLNLVGDEDKQQLFRELFRVVKQGGRAVISDIVSDKPSTPEMKKDADLWSGCISGALVEREFLAAFVLAGFDHVEVLERGAEPWRVVDGIEYRSVTVFAGKGARPTTTETSDAANSSGCSPSGGCC